MKVISGYLKGRELFGYNVETTRPTMSRVKESMFASIQNYTSDSIVLDLFCGTGSLGIEAISMGANKCYFVDNNRDIIKYLNKNINNLNVNNKSTIINKDYRDSLLYFKNNNIKFNIILVDAPYKMEVMEEIINFLTEFWRKLFRSPVEMIPSRGNDVLNKKSLQTIICGDLLE